MKKNKRRQYFINKGFQGEFILKFCGLVALGSIIFGVILYVFSSKTLTTSFENSRLVVKSTADFILPGILFGIVVVGFFTSIATSIVVILMTHRIAGPVYRFEKHARQIAEGDLCSDLRIRKKDQFQNLVPAFNKMTEGLRGMFLEITRILEDMDGLIENLYTLSDREKFSRDTQDIIARLREDKGQLKSALKRFRVNCR
jgi:methyl-accepting chemotaxis protein